MGSSKDTDIKRQVKELLQQELPNVIKVALTLVNNDRVAPSARAKLISDIFRANGLYAESDDERQKEPFEMTAKELDQAIKELQKRTKGNLFD